MRQVVVLTPEDARCGFALTGVRHLTPAAEELPGALRELAADPTTGVIIVDERLVAGGAQEHLRELDRRWPGLVIVMPGPGAPASVEEDYVLQLIRRAIGYQVRLGA